MALGSEARQELDRLRQDVSRLLTDPQFPAVVEALNDPAIRREAQASPETFLRRRGLDVPDHAKVTIGEVTEAGAATPRKLELGVHIDWCSRRNPKFCIKIDFDFSR